jgi:dihydroorotase-like cyclic amidohydrolase
VDICRNAHLNNQPLYAETCPHYLTFTEDVYNREDGYLYLISPPLRKQADIDALWKEAIQRAALLAKEMGTGMCQLKRVWTSAAMLI